MIEVREIQTGKKPLQASKQANKQQTDKQKQNNSLQKDEQTVLIHKGLKPKKIQNKQTNNKQTNKQTNKSFSTQAGSCEFWRLAN